MTWYVLRRVLQMIPVFFGATFLVYFLVFFMPGDPIAALGGDKPLPEAAQIRLREEFNLDKPFLVQYFLYLANIFQGDLGSTFRGQSIASQLTDAFPITIRLALIAIIFETIFGILAGVISGLRKRSEEHTSELQSRGHLVCRLLLEKKKKIKIAHV